MKNRKGTYWRRRDKANYHYFKMNQSQRESLRDALNNKERLAELKDATGEKDDDVLQLLVDIGLDKDSIGLLHLVPLLQVAWADQEIQAEEDKLLRQLAEARGIKHGSHGYELLDGWLQRRPADAVFDACEQVIRTMLEDLPEGEQTKAYDDLAELIFSVAQVAGGLFGIGSVSSDEREIIDKLTHGLKGE